VSCFNDEDLLFKWFWVLEAVEFGYDPGEFGVELYKFDDSFMRSSRA
jgi:hypothetical protein